jgi:hypothetical protein
MNPFDARLPKHIFFKTPGYVKYRLPEDIDASKQTKLYAEINIELGLHQSKLSDGGLITPSKGLGKNTQGVNFWV